MKPCSRSVDSSSVVFGNLPQQQRGAGLAGSFWRLLGASLALGIWLVLGAATVVQADSGDVRTLPSPGRKLKSGWSVEVDHRTVASNGYSPMRVTASQLPAGAVSKVNRTLRIEITPNAWYPQRTMTVVQNLEVPAGANSGSTTMLVPQDRQVHSFHFRVFEDGKELDDLSEDFGVMVFGGNQFWSEARPSMLFIDSNAPASRDRMNWSMQVRTKSNNQGTKSELLPDIRPLAQWTTDNSTGIGYVERSHPSDPVLIDSLRTWPRVQLLPPSELPKRWIEYSCYDVIFISWADLQKLAASDSEALAALRAWTTSGRVLCVLGMGANYEQLGPLEKLVGMPAIQYADKHPRRGWASPVLEAFRPEINGLRAGAAQNNPWGQVVAMGPGGVAMATTVDVSAPTPPPNPTAAEVAEADPARLAKSFVWRGWGMGAVVGFESERPFPGTGLQWCGLFNTLPANNWMWYQRNGLSLQRDNSGFWNGWIPGIGKAPVTTFLVMITIFTFVIGPLNYFWLRSRKRTYWMLVTVPAGAGVVTVMLLAYAMIADGLGVKARLRSFSWIDQRTGQTVTWSRQSYYAGISPRDGLVYPDDVTAIPLEAMPGEKDMEGGRRLIEWSGNQQKLKTGYLSSRTMQQMMVVQSRHGDARLDVRDAGADQAPVVLNRLGSPIDWLVMRDAHGTLYWSDGGADRETLKLDGVDLSGARAKISNAIAQRALQAPPGAEYVEHLMMNRRRRYYGYFNDTDRSLAPPSVFTSLLEVQLRNVSALEELPLRTYVAGVSNSPLVPVGVDKYVEAGSLHVVWGQW